MVDYGESDTAVLLLWPCGPIETMSCPILGLPGKPSVQGGGYDALTPRLRRGCAVQGARRVGGRPEPGSMAQQAPERVDSGIGSHQAQA